MSRLAKGSAKLGPYLEKLHFTIDFVTSSAGIEPIAGTALGAIKGVVTIAIMITGAIDELTAHLQTFIERIPFIERCNEALKNKKPAAAYEVACLLRLLHLTNADDRLSWRPTRTS